MSRVAQLRRLKSTPASGGAMPRWLGLKLTKSAVAPSNLVGKPRAPLPAGFVLCQANIADGAELEVTELAVFTERPCEGATAP